ncbi:MurR/RpiR family transcriptional regulator [Couchioplanes azureus]|uniref:MurR/RpiR family transcriptional regulator n=1 Tax=Couchioplanes caeruleus TaxID=56438 RepID=UPI00167045E2|nr:MurR/RpiR family transcriptional regulator [Couchioplanes caeruleus]GGQ76803.1 transcriptional regulator [Couchioplanes caeruleus subsp. azureus]
MNDVAVGTGGRVLGLFQGARLTPTQRRIAHSLVQHGPSAAYLSAAEVAELAGVSQPSVTRFAMALGYAGYPALRRELRALAAEPAIPPEPGENPMQEALRAESRRLERMADELGDLRAIEQAAGMLVGSRPLPVLGLRAAAPLAGYFGYFAAKVHPDVRVLDGGGTILLDRLDQARAAGASAVLAIVLPRCPRETLDAIREAKELGLAVVALTDSAVSPVAEAADVVLPAPVGTQLVFDLHTGPMAMAMVLLQAMCDAAPETAQRRLEEFEATAIRRHIFEA